MENTTLMIGLIAFFCSTVYLAAINTKIKSENKALERENISVFSTLDDKQKRLTNYVLTSIELNNICDKFSSSRKEKAKNEKLQELLNELN